MDFRPIVAIDGPAGAGKSTLARLLAARLGYTYIDSGAMYRAVALLAADAEISWDDEPALGELARSLSFLFDGCRLLVDGRDVSSRIRSARIGAGASLVSRWPSVREALVAAQRAIGAGGGVVMEGRDIGTVVFPDAGVKVYLTASLAERSRRRCADLEALGERHDPSQVLRAMEERDRRDREREHSPLAKAPGAVEVATDGRSVEELIERLAGLVAAACREGKFTCSTA